MQTLRFVQVLRAVAALGVVLFHMQGHYVYNGGNALMGTIFSTLWMGVDVFFVLSGFIMWYATSDDTEPGRFMLKRVTRIFVSLWPALALTLLFGVWTGQRPFDWPQVLKNLTLFNLNPDHETMYMYVAWTLTYEMVFYLVFGLLLVVGRRYAFVFAVATAIVLEVLSFATSNLGLEIPSLLRGRVFYEFAFGAIVAHLLTRPSPRSLHMASGLVGALLLVGGIYYSGWRDLTANVLFVGGGTALLLFALPAIEPFFAGETGRRLAVVGDWSYAMYLIHPAVIYVTYFGGVYWRLIEAIGPEAYMAAYVLVVLVVSWAFYRLVEVPLLALVRSFLGGGGSSNSPSVAAKRELTTVEV